MIRTFSSVNQHGWHESQEPLKNWTKIELRRSALPSLVIKCKIHDKLWSWKQSKANHSSHVRTCSNLLAYMEYTKSNIYIYMYLYTYIYIYTHTPNQRTAWQALILQSSRDHPNDPSHAERHSRSSGFYARACQWCQPKPAHSQSNNASKQGA